MSYFRKPRMGRWVERAMMLGVMASWGTAEVIDIGSRRELFVDHTMIESMDGVELRMHEPRSEGVTLQFDQAWEGKFSAYASVINDGGQFKMYYRGLPSAAPETKAVVCYAQSRDGVTHALFVGAFGAGHARHRNIIDKPRGMFEDCR